MTTKQRLRGIVGVVIVLVVVLPIGQSKAQSAPPDAKPPVVAKPDTPPVQPPSADFLKKYDQLLSLADTVNEYDAATKVLRAKVVQLDGELRAEVPTGYQFNPQSRMFVPAPPLPVALPAAPKPSDPPKPESK